MPPEGKPLTPAEIDVFKTWIAEGAEYQTHWAYRTLGLAAPAESEERGGRARSIDAFVISGSKQ